VTGYTALFLFLTGGGNFLFFALALAKAHCFANFGRVAACAVCKSVCLCAGVLLIFLMLTVRFINPLNL
jgi:hypothetical protein